MSKGKSAASAGVSTDDKTIHYKPVMSRSATITLLHITNSHKAMIKNHMHYPMFMACTGAAVISLTSHLYTKALSPTNGLGTRLVIYMYPGHLQPGFSSTTVSES